MTSSSVVEFFRELYSEVMLTIRQWLVLKKKPKPTEYRESKAHNLISTDACIRLNQTICLNNE